MMVAVLKVLLPCYCVLAAYTDEFLQAFNNLGLDQWTGIEMDVAWGHVTSLRKVSNLSRDVLLESVQSSGDRETDLSLFEATIRKLRKVSSKDL